MPTVHASSLTCRSNKKEAGRLRRDPARDLPLRIPAEREFDVRDPFPRNRGGHLHSSVKTLFIPQ